jgi:hypothetical protein
VGFKTFKSYSISVSFQSIPIFSSYSPPKKEEEKANPGPVVDCEMRRKRMTTVADVVWSRHD